MKTIILHIGMHKTGSSSIQRTLQDFDDGKTRYAQLGDLNHSIPLFSIFSEQRFERRHFIRKGLSPAELRAIVAEFETMLDQEMALERDTLILSAEDLSTLKSEKDVAAMKRRLEVHGANVRVMAYVREPVGFSSSSFQQKVRVGYAHPEIPPVAYRDRFGPFVSVFGADAVEFMKFDPAAFPGGSVTLDFLDRIGVARDAVEEKTANTSLSAAATRLLFLFNTSGPIAHGNPMVFDARKRLTIALRRATVGDEGFKFPKELILAQQSLHDDIAWLRDHVGIDFNPGEAGILSEDEIATQVASHLEVNETDRTALRQYCEKKKVRIPSGADALMMMSMMFYHEIHLMGKKRSA